MWIKSGRKCKKQKQCTIEIRLYLKKKFLFKSYNICLRMPFKKAETKF